MELVLGGTGRRPLRTATVCVSGIWTTYKGPVKKDGLDVVQDVFSFMTTMPNELTASINHERMPVLLTREEQFDIWLNGTPQDATELARTFRPTRCGLCRRGWRGGTSWNLWESRKTWNSAFEAGAYEQPGQDCALNQCGQLSLCRAGARSFLPGAQPRPKQRLPGRERRCRPPEKTRGGAVPPEFHPVWQLIILAVAVALLD